MPDYIDQVFGPGGVLAKRFPSYEMRTGQVALARLVDAAMREGHHAMGEGPCGCHVAGQQILLSNGRTLAVEDIQVGHQLMGPDGTPRTVLALARGSQETVQIQPSNGAPWRVNLDHILTLIRTTNDSIVDVRVRDWLAWSPSQKAQYALFRAITPQFPLKDLQRTSFHAIPTGLVEPYFGFSLDGDGRYLLGDFTVTHNTGKSVAYSVPAIWHARHRDKRVLICTANIALQEQLVNTDLPMLAEVLPWTFSFALVKDGATSSATTGWPSWSSRLAAFRRRRGPADARRAPVGRAHLHRRHLRALVCSGPRRLEARLGDLGRMPGGGLPVPGVVLRRRRARPRGERRPRRDQLPHAVRAPGGEAQHRREPGAPRL
ncbi:MAG: hypothetical protein IPI49_19580 [Myxococcales bacterium]|nr:hypothetical protein [Myxococcales bacterium]